MNMQIMNGKKGLIMGILNERSLSYAAAQSLHDNGAELIFSYPSENLKERVKKIAKNFNSDAIYECDVCKEEMISKLFEDIANQHGKIDFIVHAIAFADKNELAGDYLNTTYENFKNAMMISCWSLTSVTKAALPILNEGSSILTFSYYGANKVMPNYNVMGICKAALEASVKYLSVDLGKRNIRINALSAGPMKTLASSGIENFKKILDWNQHNSPLRRNTTLKDIEGSSLFLLSDMSSGVTGEIMYVDSGYHVVGMKNPDYKEE